MLSFPCMTLVIVTSSTQLLSSNEFSPLPIIIILKFSIWVFFHENARFTGQQGKREAFFPLSFFTFIYSRKFSSLLQ